MMMGGGEIGGGSDSEHTHVDDGSKGGNEINANPQGSLEGTKEAATDPIEFGKPASEVSNGKLPEAGENLEGVSEAIESENQAIDEHFQEMQEARWGESPEVLEQKQEIIQSSLEMGKEAYESASIIAGKDESLRVYSDHTDTRHIPQVMEKSLEAMDQLQQAAANNPEAWEGTLSTNCSENTLLFAAALHDTGMAGRVAEGTDPVKQYEEREKAHEEGKDPSEKGIGAQIRSEHSYNSALFALSKRDEVEALNRSLDEKDPEGKATDRINVDEAALIIALHSKSAALGENQAKVQDLSDQEAMLQYASELKSMAEQSGLRFDDSFLYSKNESGELVPDPEAISRVTTEAAALRLGDSFRPSSEVPISQAGDAVMIDASHFNPDATTIEEELKDVEVGFYTPEGKEVPDARLDSNSTSQAEVTSKAYSVGEKNIADVKCGEPTEDGTLTTEVFLRDGNVCPLTTGFAISERMKESISLNEEMQNMMVYRIHSSEAMTPESREKMEHQIRRELEPRTPAPDAPQEQKDEEALVTDKTDSQRGQIQIEFVDD